MDEWLSCCYCGKRFIFPVMRSTDHLIPTSRGGVNKTTNKRNCCQTCNNLKANYFPEHFLFVLKQKRKNIIKRYQDPSDTSIIAERLKEIDTMIKNTKLIITYVNHNGAGLFVDNYFYEDYLDEKGLYDGK